MVPCRSFTYPASVAIESRAPVELVTLDNINAALAPDATNCDTLLRQAYGAPPIVDVHRLDLSIRPSRASGALATTIDVTASRCICCRRISAFASHERRFQVGSCCRIAIRTTLARDRARRLNDWLPGRSAAHVLDRRLGASARLRSFPSRRPLLPLDRIWIHPVSVLRRVLVHTSALARHASDHLPVVADLDLAAATIASDNR